MHIDEVKNNQFYQFPQWLFEEPYNAMSDKAKLLYMLFFDRRSLSVKNGWFDDNGRVYLYFTNKKLMKLMGCSEPPIITAKQQLKDFGLITEIQQGNNKPNKIYISGTKESLAPELKNFKSGTKESLVPELKNFKSNQTNINHTNTSRLSEPDNNNNTNTIYSVFEQEFGRLLSPSQIRLIDDLVADYSEPLVLEALKETVKQGKYHNYNYLRGILDNWKNANLLTVEQVRASQEQRSRNRKHRDSNFEYDEQYNFERIAEEG